MMESSMKVFYSDMELPQKFGKSIFLAGPTPRDADIKSWRLEALEILEKAEYDGSVFIPERQSGWAGVDYIEQVKWEHDALADVDIIVFWIPRDIEGKMPGFTTNVEFGMCIRRDNVVYGRPDKSDKNRYLDYLYKQQMGLDPHRCLKSTLRKAVEKADWEESERIRAIDEHCCMVMAKKCSDLPACDVHDSKWDCPDCLIHYDRDVGEYGIIVHDYPRSWIPIQSCPWCGMRLKRAREEILSGDLLGKNAHGRLRSHERRISDKRYLND
jgi:hypothetical protein